MTFDRFASRDWASATFVGRQYEFAILVEGYSDEVAARAEWVKTVLCDQIFDLPGEVVADIALTDSVTMQGADAQRQDRLFFEALSVLD